MARHRTRPHHRELPEQRNLYRTGSLERGGPLTKINSAACRAFFVPLLPEGRITRANM
jgi:hypothetical protein